MNTIVKAITPDGNTGFDEFDQLFCWTDDKFGGKIGSVIHDVRGQICPLCGNHWKLTSEGLKDQVYLHDTLQYAHRSCYQRLIAHKNRQNIISDLWMAGIADFTLIEVANQYSADSTPWYLIKLNGRKDQLVFGSRKRVWSFSFEFLTVPQQLAFEEEFKTLDTTKGTGEGSSIMYYIHSWSRESNVKFLKFWNGN